MTRPRSIRPDRATTAVLGAVVLLAGVLGIFLALGIASPEVTGGAPRERALRILSDVSRALGVALSMTAVLFAIAIPLTANVYTPRLIEIFVQDRRNQLILAYYVLANGTVLSLEYALGGTTGPSPLPARPTILVSLVLGVGGLILFVPYAYYILGFLDPRNIVARLRGEVLAQIEEAAGATDPDELHELRASVLEDIQYLGNVSLRSADRYDRDTAFEAIEALRQVFDAYGDRKDDLADPWFRKGATELRGVGPELEEEVLRKEALTEVAILEEVGLVLPLAMEKVPELVEGIATLCRHMGLETSRDQDIGAREMVTLYFNTFIRTTLQDRDSKAFYRFVYQYRLFAEGLLDIDSGHACRIAFFLDYYGHQAVRMDLGYLINVVAYDLASLVDLAQRKQNDSRHELLDILIELDRDEAALMEMPGVVKAQIIVAAKFLTRDLEEGAERLVDELAKVSRGRLEKAFDQIFAAREENFWEIADRRRHLDHVDERFRPAVDELHGRLLGESEPTPSPG